VDLAGIGQGTGGGEKMRLTLIVAAAGFLGAGLRYAIGVALPESGNGQMPWATLIVNLSGSLLLGWLTGIASRRKLPEWLTEAAGTGFLGAFTTFSAFSAQWISLMGQGHFLIALLYTALSGGLGAGLAFAGWHWGRGRPQ
jgi:CrcB protein